MSNAEVEFGGSATVVATTIRDADVVDLIYIRRKDEGTVTNKDDVELSAGGGRKTFHSFGQLTGRPTVGIPTVPTVPVVPSREPCITTS